MFAPENVRIAPSARSAAPVNSSTIALNWSLIAPVKSGAIPPASISPAPEEPDCLSLLIVVSSSKSARLPDASFAASPTPSIAFCWLYRAFADWADLLIVVPNSSDNSLAIALTIRVITLINSVNAGIITSTIGCASVINAPFNRAIAATASSFVLMADHM